MADERRFVVETDFLFGLRRSDELYRFVTMALDMNLEGKLDLAISGAAPIEASAVMASQGLGEEEIGKALFLIETVLASYGLDNYIVVTVPDARKASSLRRFKQ